jgi:hypothetical protein
VAAVVVGAVGAAAITGAGVVAGAAAIAGAAVVEGVLSANAMHEEPNKAPPAIRARVNLRNAVSYYSSRHKFEPLNRALASETKRDLSQSVAAQSYLSRIPRSAAKAVSLVRKE